jgi:hypothetical protein
MEIGTSNKVSTTPAMVQPITKLVSPLRGGIGLKIIPLPIQSFTIHVQITIVVNQPVEGNERFDKR